MNRLSGLTDQHPGGQADETQHRQDRAPLSRVSLPALCVNINALENARNKQETLSDEDAYCMSMIGMTLIPETTSRHLPPGLGMYLSDRLGSLTNTA